MLDFQSQSSGHARYEREKRDLEQAHMKIVKQLEARKYELEASNKVCTLTFIQTFV